MMLTEEDLANQTQNLSQWHFFNHKSHMDRHVIEPGCPTWQTDDQGQCHGTTFSNLKAKLSGTNGSVVFQTTIITSRINSSTNSIYSLTPRSTVLLEKQTGSQLVKKFTALYGTRRVITALTRARHLSWPWASSIQSIPPHPTSWRAILILPSYLRLGLPTGLFTQVSPPKTCTHLSPSPIRATCPTHLILLDFITRTILSEKCISRLLPPSWTIVT